MNAPLYAPPGAPLPLQPSSSVLQALEQSSSRSFAAAAAIQQAMDGISALYGQGQFKALQTLSATSLLTQAAASQGLLTPAIAQQLEAMTQDYLRNMSAASQIGAHHLLQIANEVAMGSMKQDGLQARLSRLLKG